MNSLSTNKTTRFSADPLWHLKNDENENDSLYQRYLSQYSFKEDEMEIKDPLEVLKRVEDMINECLIGLMKISSSRKKIKSRLKFFNKIGLPDRINPLKKCDYMMQAFLKMVLPLKEDVNKFEDPVKAIRDIIEEDVILFDEAMLEAGNVALTFVLKEALDPELIMEDVVTESETEVEIGSDKYDAQCWRHYKEVYANFTAKYEKGEGVFDAVFQQEFEKAYENKIRVEKLIKESLTGENE